MISPSVTYLYFRLLTSIWRTIYPSTHTKTFTPTYVHMSSSLICFHTNKNIQAQNEILFLNASVWGIHSVYMYPYTCACLRRRGPSCFTCGFPCGESALVVFLFLDHSVIQMNFGFFPVFQNQRREHPCNVTSILFLVSGYKQTMLQ